MPPRRCSVTDEEIRQLEALRLEAVQLRGADDAVIAEVRLGLMERALDVLQLLRCGNAPENHGWMNLFRRWGNEEPIRTHYEHYIHGRTKPIDEDPIHHTWLRPAPGVFMDSGRTEPPVCAGSRPGAAGIVDFKGSNDQDQAYEKSSGTGEQGPTAPNE